MLAGRLVPLAGLLCYGLAAQRDAPPPTQVDWFFEATSFDERVAATALERIAAGWQPGHAALLIDLARFTRSSAVPGSEDLSDLMPPIDPQGAPAMPIYRGAQFGTIGSPRHEVTAPIRRRLVRFLERQTGQKFGDDLDGWRRWLWKAPYDPHPEYAAFKAALYGRIDSAIAQFFTGAARSVVRLDEIEWSGVGPNEAAPLFYPPAAAAGPGDRDRIIGIGVGGAARAYARDLLAVHQLVHDRVGEAEVLVVVDALGRAAAAYALPGTGAALPRFGTSGLVYRSMMLMFEERTRSLWSPLSGAAVVGEDAGAARLQRVPIVETTWRAWRERYPSSTAVWLPPARRLAPGDAPSPFTYPLPKPPFLKASARVAVVGGMAIPLEALPEDGVRDFESPHEVVTAITSGEGGVALYDGAPSPMVRRLGDRVIDARGGVWRIHEDALVEEGGAGRRLARRAAPVGWWSVWHAHDPSLRPARPRVRSDAP